MERKREKKLQRVMYTDVEKWAWGNLRLSCSLKAMKQEN